ncbi:MAG: PVC-type heme-binding CxxCH protein, partial [Bdellovibrionales bacterium]
KALTINGIHLNEYGNQKVAEVIDKALNSKAPGAEKSTEQLEKIRQAVMDKNYYWFNRYRTVDGYSIYGGRSHLRFVDGQTNREVMQREMEILDVMTDNRDRRIWAVAQGGDLKVDDSNTPPFIPVKTNKPGPLPGGKHLFLDGQDAIKKMNIAKGFKVTLFASEKEFPALINPVQMAFDTKGRLWVATWPTYPHWKPKGEMNDQLLIFEDTDGDGKADKMKVFAEGLHNPTGFEFWNGGVIVAHAPDIMFLKDTDGDDKADIRVRVISGMDSADTHHTSNSFILDPGGALYFQEGTFHHTQVETPWGDAARCANAGVFRYEPRAQKFEVYVNHGFANPHGHAFDRWGQDIVVDGTGAVPYHGTLFSGQTDYPQRHNRPPQVYNQRTRPCPAIEYLSSRHFPKEIQGNLLVANVIGFQGLLQYKITDQASSIKGTEGEPILSSSDPNFRPVDMEVGPDGGLYFVDWQNPIIGHMQHNLRDPSRDNLHGRIYKVTYENRDLLKPPAVAGEPIAKLLDLLKEPEDRLRYRVRIELGGRDTAKVLEATQKWIAGLDRKDPEHEHHLLEALWLYQNHNVVNQYLLKQLLRSPDFRARAAATKVLCYWRDRVENPLDLLRTQINDSHPRVRLEAIRALSFFHDEEALAVALELLAHPDDQYLRYTFNETLNTLERRLGSGKINRGNIAASLLRMLQKQDVNKDRVPVLLETICRHGSNKELSTIWQQAVHSTRYSGALRSKIFEWLAEAALTRGVIPEIQGGEIEAILKENDPDQGTLPAAIHLVSAWKVKDAGKQLQKIAKNPKVDLETRFAAIDGLAALNGTESQSTLKDLLSPTHQMPIRYRAAVALSNLDLKAGAKAAAKALAHAKESDDPSYLVEAFLVRKNGSDSLAEALAKEKVSVDTAKQILRAMYLAGRNDAKLGNVVSKFAGIDAAPKPPTPAEVKILSQLVMEKGDAARGEKIFRRADLGCVKCHSINKAGGNIGPDLGPIGGSSPVDYIVTSILDPNASIKEEYLTKVIVTSTGQLLTGVEVERTKNQVTLKDATGKLLRIPLSNIDEEAKGKSLMPEGITRILTKAEVIDLMRFISELGKPGSYAIRNIPTIQRWKVLRKVPSALQEDVPNRDLVRDYLLSPNATAWETIFAKVNGQLPLSEIRKTGKEKYLYLQGEIRVVQRGAVRINVDSNQPVVFWVDEEPFEKQSSAVLNLSPGRHRITVRTTVPSGQESALLKVELGRPAQSRAHFEMVQGD